MWSQNRAVRLTTGGSYICTEYSILRKHSIVRIASIYPKRQVRMYKQLICAPYYTVCTAASWSMYGVKLSTVITSFPSKWQVFYSVHTYVCSKMTGKPSSPLVQSTVLYMYVCTTQLKPPCSRYQFLCHIAQWNTRAYTPYRIVGAPTDQVTEPLSETSAVNVDSVCMLCTE